MEKVDLDKDSGLLLGRESPRAESELMPVSGTQTSPAVQFDQAFSEDDLLSANLSVDFSARSHTVRTSVDLDFNVITLTERINNINLSIEWIREELVAMRAVDWSLKRQFHELNRQIRHIKNVFDQEESLHGWDGAVRDDTAESDKAKVTEPKNSGEDSGFESENNLSPLAYPRYFFEMTI